MQIVSLHSSLNAVWKPPWEEVGVCEMTRLIPPQVHPLQIGLDNSPQPAEVFIHHLSPRLVPQLAAIVKQTIEPECRQIHLKSRLELWKEKNNTYDLKNITNGTLCKSKLKVNRTAAN